MYVGVCLWTGWDGYGWSNENEHNHEAFVKEGELNDGVEAAWIHNTHPQWD